MKNKSRWSPSPLTSGLIFQYQVLLHRDSEGKDFLTSAVVLVKRMISVWENPVIVHRSGRPSWLR